mgnify:CR=1 FL=1
METSEVRRQVQHALGRMRTREQERRRMVAEAQQAYGVFLESVATPLVRQVAGALKAEGLAFTVSTDRKSTRLNSSHT